MKFNLKTEIFDETLTKVVLLATPGAKVEPMQLSQLMMQLLLSDGEKPTVPDVKTKNFALMMKVVKAEEAGIVDISLDDISILKGLADAHCPTLIHGRITQILENPISG